MLVRGGVPELQWERPRRKVLSPRRVVAASAATAFNGAAIDGWKSGRDDGRGTLIVDTHAGRDGQAASGGLWCEVLGLGWRQRGAWGGAEGARVTGATRVVAVPWRQQREHDAVTRWCQLASSKNGLENDAW